jgi:hypothetical protein
MTRLPTGLIIDSIAILCAIFAIWRGGRGERAAAFVVIANIAIGDIGRLVAPDANAVIRLVNDGLTALILLACTLRYGALWMGGVMLFFAAQFAMHSYYLVTGRTTRDYLYVLINNLNFSGVILCLFAGTIAAWRQRARTAARPAP